MPRLCVLRIRQGGFMMFWRSWPQMVPTLLGTLLGVRTATVYAREYPEDVRSLAVLEPVFTFS